jgi:hypothetical protein
MYNDTTPISESEERPISPVTNRSQTTLRDPEKLAKLLAPYSRDLCEVVEGALERGDIVLSSLKDDWCSYLTPDADDHDFAEAYAQIVTFGLLLARLAGVNDLSSHDKVAEILDVAHPLLSTAIRNALDPDLRRKSNDLVPPLDALIQFLEGVEPAQLADERDLWIHFYEDYLAAYDPKLRASRGVYYTPKEVVETQVRLVAELLRDRFGCRMGFADDNVITLDPACGTGAYLMEVINEIEREVRPDSSKVAEAAKRVCGFEILAGPYTVAHLNLTRQIASIAPASALESFIQVYLTDTLESPDSSSLDYLSNTQRGEKYKQDKESILVCIGNPPYDREQRATTSSARRKGGWVRYGDEAEKPLIDDFLAPLRDVGGGGHAKNLYNDYVYFWRWALWKISEIDPTKGGIVSFITPNSYLVGPGFAGMRQMMRQVFDEIWIIDLGGDGRGADADENVFAIRTPVTIAVGVRLPGHKDAKNPSSAQVRYLRIAGSAKDKLAQLTEITFESSDVHNAPSDGSAPLLPSSGSAWASYPLLSSIFPWQTGGVQVKRTWPIATHKDVLLRRWRELISRHPTEREDALKPTRDRNILSTPMSLWIPEALPSLSSITSDDHEPIVTYAYRSFDRRCILTDTRVVERPRRELWAAHSDRQVYLTSLLTKPIGNGPAAVATSSIPDLDHFSGRGGGQDVIPLYRDAGCSVPNVDLYSLHRLSSQLGQVVLAEDIFAYCCAILSAPSYTARFKSELALPGIRVPISSESDTFFEAVNLGRDLIWWHTFGERFVPSGHSKGFPAAGRAQCLKDPAHDGSYPEKFSYDEATQTLHVGEGKLKPVSKEVWDFQLSGFYPLRSWLGYRMASPKGKKSSPLDEIRQTTWTTSDTEELLRVCWILERTTELAPELNSLLDRVLDGPLIQIQPHIED